MAVSIRLKRLGRKRNPFYRVIVADSRTPRQGRAVDDLGFYDPMKDPVQIEIDQAKALTWLSEGAVPTDTARSLLSKAGILQAFHQQNQPGAEGEDKEEETPAAEDKEEAPAVEQPDSESDGE